MEERHWRLHSSLAHSNFWRRGEGEERSIEFPLEFSWGFGAASVEEQIFLGVLGVWQLEEHSYGHLDREHHSFITGWLPCSSVVLRGTAGSLFAARPVGFFQEFRRPQPAPMPLLHPSRVLPLLPVAHRGRATPL
eukprot:Gb_06047 [translate_table: standard]